MAVTGLLATDVAGNHLDRALLASSRWKNLKGRHVPRHSFASACANAGMGQRLVDEWMGHESDEQKKRYRHLYPSTQRAALAGVFD